MNNQPVKQQNTPAATPKTIQQLLNSDAVTKMLRSRLQDESQTKSFITSLIHIANSNEMLKKADPNTILGAAMLSSSLNLPLNNALGQSYIVPFNNKQKDGTYKVEAQFQIGYKGLKNLAIRSGQFKELIAKEVYEGQVVDDDSFLGYHFDWKAKKSNKVIGYASYFKLLSGFESTYYMTTEEVEAHAKKYSQTYKKYGTGLWKDDFDKMALKTVSKLHLNSGEAPLSIEMQKATVGDQAIIRNWEDEDTIDVDYVDNTPEATVEITEEEQELQRLKEFLAKATTIEQVTNIEESLPMLLPEHKELIDAKKAELTKDKPAKNGK